MDIVKTMFDANTTHNSFITLTLLAVILIITLKLYIVDQIVNKREVISSLDRGWYFINWDMLKNEKYVKKALKELTNSYDDDRWHESFVIAYFDKLHFRDIFSLLSLCKEIHEDNVLALEDKKNLKRLVTASGVLFSYKVPVNLWLLDSTTLEMILKYSIICQCISPDISKFKDSYIKIPDNVDNRYFQNVLKAIPNGFTYMNKIGSNNRPPNIIHLFKIISKNNNKLFTLLNEDINNLRRVMTICYTLSGINVPRDYLLVDENVFMYLSNPSYFKERKKHLTLVKSN